MASQQAIDNDLVRNVPSERSSLLTEMLVMNHKNYSLLIHGNLHNHLPHVLGSAYLLGASDEHLRATFDTVVSDLEEWQPSSVSITDDGDLDQHLGDTTYQRAFVIFFDQRLAASGSDWKSMVCNYLLERKSPLLGGTVGGFGHPLILLADAFELASAEVAVEALALTAVDYNPLAKIIDLDQEPQEGRSRAADALEILQKMHSDPRFDGVFASPGVQNTAVILRSEFSRELSLEYFDLIDFADTAPQVVDANLRELTKVAVLLLSTTQCHDGPPAELQKHKVDFYLAHQLTLCWCLRVLVPSFPSSATSRLFRSVWLLMVLACLHQQRPAIKPDILDDTPLAAGSTDSEWNRLREAALDATKDRGFDPHFVKVIRTLWEFSKIWPEDKEMFLKAAVRFEYEFEGWTGFGKEGEEKMDIAN